MLSPFGKRPLTLAVLAWIAACGDPAGTHEGDGTYGSGAQIGSGGSAMGTGGTAPSTGGATPGTGGAAPGTGGAAPSTGGAAPSTGGATPGTGGTTPGTGGAAPGTGGTTPGTGGTTPGSGGSTVADGGSGTITAQYGAAAVYSGGRQYIIQNNVWASNSSQAISYDANSFTITQQTGNNDNQAAPVSFPSIFIGSNHGRTSQLSGLPKQVSTIGGIPLKWSHNGGSAGGNYNAAIDVWFSTSSAGDPEEPSGGFLMVWLHMPNNARPISDNGNSSTGQSVNIAGVNYDIWYGHHPDFGIPCVSYVSQGTVGSVDFDLKEFFDDAIGRSYVNSGWYLTNVFAGFEIWSGGVNLSTTEFTVEVN